VSALDSVSGLRARVSFFSQQLGLLHAHPSIQLKFVELFFYKLILLRVISSSEGDFIIRSKYASARDELWVLRQRAISRRWVRPIHPDVSAEFDLLDRAMQFILKNFDDACAIDAFFPSLEGVPAEKEPILKLSVQSEQDSLSDVVASATTTPSAASSQSTVSAASAPAPRRSARRCDACADREKRRAMFIVAARALLKKT
jgi:hypothetical protein